jgi:DNA replication protein DnaC
MSDADVLAALHALGLRAGRDALQAWLAHATQSRLAPVQVVEGLIDVERRVRAATNLARRTRTAALGTIPALDGFDWNHPRRIDRPLYETLLGLDFVRAGENVLLRGPSGVGKTTLAQNLGVRALTQGRHVRFTTLAGCVADLLKQESSPALERRLRRYTTPDLLVVDEIGFLPCEHRAADLLFTIISRRHEKRSTVITTNLSYKEWSSVFPGAACVVALVDRFAQHCHVLDIDADSWRQKASRARRK